MSKLEASMVKNMLNSSEKPPVMFIPGGIMPAELVYGPLLGVIGDQIRPFPKELEVYAAETPPPGYSLELEVEGIRRVVDDFGLDQFHLVIYSGGGAIALAFVAKYPERIQSLALVEPASIGSVPPEDLKESAELDRIITLPPDQQMPAFVRWHMRPGVQPPSMSMPPGPPPPWMKKRPAGLRALSQAFNLYHIDQQRFRLMDRPVYYALGSLSTRYFEHEARIRTGLFPDIQVEEYEGRSHFDPPHRAEPERFGQALTALWARSDAALVAKKR